jgi:hypothetical protein
MPVTGFYNDNANRSYPFVTDLEGPAWLPAAIVDFGCVVGVDTTFDESTDVVYLYRVSRSGSTFTFEFRSDEEILSYYSLIFTRSLSDGEYVTEYAEADVTVGNSESAFTPDCSGAAFGPPIWDGFLITGELTELAAAIADGGSWTAAAAEIQVEPVLIKNMRDMYARSINLANAARVRVTAAESCSSETELDDQDFYENATCIYGELVAKEGYNCRIIQSKIENSLTFDVSQGGGAGEPCEEVPIYDGEPTPANSTVFSGGPTCHEIITSLNGVAGTSTSPQLIKLVGGAGVQINPTIGVPHSIDVAIDLSDFTVCELLLSSSSGGD